MSHALKISKLTATGRRPLKLRGRAWCVLAVVFMLRASAAAMPFEDYHERVNRAVTTLNRLLAAESGNPRQTTTIFRELRSALPPHCAVEREAGSALEVDNTWLDEALKEYEQHFAERGVRANRAALASIAERLQALDERLLELERAEKVSNSGGDNHARLNAILERMSKGRERKDDQKTALARLSEALTEVLRKFFEWLRDLLPSAPRIQPIGGASGLPKLALALICALLVGLLALLVWKLGPSLLGSFRKKRTGEKRAARVVLGERVEADENAADLFAEAEALARRGETRAAIRKAYIALLCELGDRKLLRLAQHKTNRDYLQALSWRPALHAEMQPLTNDFESCWYGAGTSGAQQHDWNAFRAQCQQALAESDK